MCILLLNIIKSRLLPIGFNKEEIMRKILVACGFWYHLQVISSHKLQYAYYNKILIPLFYLLYSLTVADTGAGG